MNYSKVVAWILLLGCFAGAREIKIFGSHDLNLNLERVDANKFPVNWEFTGGGGESYPNGYIGFCDDSVKHSGRYSLHLRYVTGNGFGLGKPAGNSILPDLRGKTVAIGGWIKTQNVSGYAAFWFRANDSAENVIAFRSLQRDGINGSKDWKHYSMQVDVPKTATGLNWGAIMGGSGDAWFDDITIDTNGVRYAE
jgi:hypothetical protein